MDGFHQNKIIMFTAVKYAVKCLLYQRIWMHNMKNLCKTKVFVHYRIQNHCISLNIVPVFSSMQCAQNIIFFYLVLLFFFFNRVKIASLIVLPITYTLSCFIPSLIRLSRLIPFGQKCIVAVRAMDSRINSSGKGLALSRVRNPASTWKTGIWFKNPQIAPLKAEAVSPWTIMPSMCFFLISDLSLNL